MEDDECVEIYKGKCFTKRISKRNKRVIVFDLDETLGSFIDLKILWNLLTEISSDINFNDLLDIYPEFLRYGIINILEYLYSKKKSDEYYKLYIYTNNQSQPYWIQLLTQYFQHKLSIGENDIALFDQIIYAFKINNVKYEINRTTHKKTYNDFINCTILPKNTSICFLDNTYYDNMVNDRIYYIKPTAYYHGLSTCDIIHRFLISKFGSEIILKTSMNVKLFNQQYILKCKNAGNYHATNTITKNSLERDIIISKKMMYHIKEYLLLTNYKNKTRSKPKFINRRITVKKHA